MKTLTALEAKNSFGKFLDMSQREPVIVTKRGRPVSVMISIDDLQEISAGSDKLTPEISAGIERGLADGKVRKVRRVTAENKKVFVQSIVQKFAQKQTV